MSVIPYGKYHHYKGNDYEVIGFARHSETLEDMVVYRALDDETKTWVRPQSMWDDEIEVDGKTVRRFEYRGGCNGSDRREELQHTYEQTPHISNDSDRHEELLEAHRALLSTLRKCEKIDADKMGRSQKTLLRRRIDALRLAVSLIEKEQESDHYQL